MRKTIRIGERNVGPGSPVFIIAEIGSNHDGSLEKAKEIIRASKQAGADAVKIQSFTAEGLINPLRPDEGGAWVPHPAYPVLQRLTVPDEWHRELKEYSESCGLVFLSAPFDEGRARLLESIGVDAFKIASGEVTNTPLLRHVGSFGRPVILSTGASYLDEVRRAASVLEEAGCAEVALLHCASLYPPKYEDMNIRAMATLAEEFGCPVGFSDHTPGSMVPVAAVALGASIIEKHITLDRWSDGPDHAYAMEPGEFRSMVDDIRNLEKALGDGEKKPSEHEVPERTGARRSIYTRVDIKGGTVIRAEMLKVVRHAYGLEPWAFESVVGRTASHDIGRDMPLREGDICR